MHRRNFLAACAAASLAAAKPFAQPIGLNLYTVRGPLAKDPAATYKALGAIGIKTLEVRPPNLNLHASMIRDAGLKPVHMFIESACITGAWDEWRAFGAEIAVKMKMPAPAANAPRPSLDEMIELAKRHGIQRIGTSMLIGGERTRHTIDLYNKAVEKCSAAGLELYYHNHAFEFEGQPGERFLDKLRKHSDPRLRLELDVFWAAMGGDDPVSVLKHWSGRVRSMHLKDRSPDAPKKLKELEVPPEIFREVGKGNLDFPAILHAAQKSGVEHYFIELDYSPGDPLVSVKNSFERLRQFSV